MKILLVVMEYPPYSISGASTIVRSIVKALRKRGDGVVVLSAYYSKSLFEKPHITYDTGVKIYWEPLIPNFGFSPKLKNTLPPNVFSIVSIVKLLKKENFDIVHLHGYGHFLIDYVSFLCSILHIKYILTIHGFPQAPKEKGGILGIVYYIYSKSIGKRTLAGASRYTCVSRKISKDFKELYDYQEDKVHIILNGVNLGKFKRNVDFPQELSDVLDFNYLILSIGRLSWNKGFEYAIKAISFLPDKLKSEIKYLIIGPKTDTKYYNFLRRLTSKLGLEGNLQFLGFRSQEYIISVSSKTDLFLLPSIHEGAPLAIFEAMAMGLPIVATRLEGVCEILRQRKEAELVEPKNSKKLSKAIENLFLNESYRKKLGSNARVKSKDYSLENITEKYFNVYESVL